MCGIFGYTGSRTATKLLIEGLRTLEYRGYDSAGIFVPTLGTFKTSGPIDNLAALVTVDGGTAGIAHTRWATHGEPTAANAHPHADQSGTIALVHNGIIENYRELKGELEKSGHIFLSATDTEVLAHVIGEERKNAASLVAAVRAALARVEGTYGIAVMEQGAPDTIVVARMGSPIVLGIAEHGMFVASDPSALLSHTHDVVYLEDGEMAVITPHAYEIVTLDDEPRPRAPVQIAWDQSEARRDGYDHFMMKEIMEGPEVLLNSMRGRVLSDDGLAKLGGIEQYREQLEKVERITIVGCGSAYYSALVAEYMLETCARIPVEVGLASEFRYRTPIIGKNHVVIAVSQSGETADTLAAIREAKKLGALTLGVVNVVGSTIARETDAGVYNHAGPEAGVASTKAFLSQLLVFAEITLYLGRLRGSISRDDGKEIVEAMLKLPEQLRSVLEKREAIRDIATTFKDMRDALFVGRTAHLPIAFEGALKLKEVSYIHAEGYGAGEMKHGPIAMIDEHFPTIALLPHDAVFPKMISNIEEIRARKGPVVLVTTDDAPDLTHLSPHIIRVPKTHDLLQPILSVVPLQLFAYYVGTGKGYNVDRPRNLAKAVTVE